MPVSPLNSLLQCPRCRRSALLPAAGALRCAACAVDYPSLDGIPWLFADPGGALGEWRNRLTRYLEECAAAARAAEADLATCGNALTRERLTRLQEGYREQGGRVAELLAPLELQTLPYAQAAQQAFATPVPRAQDLHSYYANLHRDWCWGEEENRLSAELVAGALGAGRGRVLILGAGACRLAYDLHRRGGHSLSVALDLNPLLLLAARRILRGETVRLVEFPLAPRTLADVAISRELRAPGAAPAGLELVFADAWAAPFAAQSFDAVVTPWLIDIVEADFGSIASHVNRLLAPGGRWVNFGSLAFPWRRPALRLSPAELLECLGAAGFRVAATCEAQLPYMRCPASRHSRLEEVLLYAADKQRRAPREPLAPVAPEWLRRHTLAVPRTTGLALAADASRIQAVLLALIDGVRSIDDLAHIVSEQGLLPADQARSAICGLLERLNAGEERL